MLIFNNCECCKEFCECISDSNISILLSDFLLILFVINFIFYLVSKSTFFKD